MKVAMINDCAFVGESLLRYLPTDIRKEHVKRTRGLWSKTFGIAYKILRTEADVYHAHYLLQDCYIAERLGKNPLIGHAHGSDLRLSLNAPLWGRIVKHNLKHCDRILVSTPDVLDNAKRFRSDAEYLPNLVDVELFHPKPPAPHGGRKRVLIASDSNWNVKGTDTAIRALSRIKNDIEVSIVESGIDFYRTVALANALGLRLNVLPRTGHERINEYYWNADVIIDRFRLGSLGLVSLEAISCGRPAVTWVSSAYQQYRDFPLKDLLEEEEIARVISGVNVDLWKEEYAYLMKNHAPQIIIPRLMKIYKEVMGELF